VRDVEVAEEVAQLAAHLARIPPQFGDVLALDVKVVTGLVLRDP
jgi:hypothetical protein